MLTPRLFSIVSSPTQPSFLLSAHTMFSGVGRRIPSTGSVTTLTRLLVRSVSSSSAAALSSHAAAAVAVAPSHRYDTQDAQKTNRYDTTNPTPARDTSIRLDGNATAATILASLKRELSPENRRPCLVMLLANSSRDSARYTQRKRDVAGELGFISKIIQFDERTVTADEILAEIDRLNVDPAVDGVMLQLPLPPHLASSQHELLCSIDPEKDVDGGHRFNTSNLAALAAREAGADPAPAQTEKGRKSWRKPKEVIHHIPCTPKACLELLDRYNISLPGKHVVVLGRSSLVGLPLTLLLLNRALTVTNIDESFGDVNARRICQQADILITAVGKANYIRADWIKEGAVVIDVGINFVPKVEPLSGLAAELENPLDAQDAMQLVGDVAYQECAKRASFITPVPGGVGPMTVAMLMENTIRSYWHRINQEKQNRLSEAEQSTIP